MGSFDPATFIPMVIVIFFAIGLHEYAHCKVADMAGDPTPRIYGRVTLNLFKHFEPLGTMMMLITAATGYGIGWGKPSPMDSSKMRNPRWDLFAAVGAGPLSNIIQATVWALIARVAMATHQVGLGDIFSFQGEPKVFLGQLLFYGVLLNLSLALFNLFPVFPLDGHWLVGLLLPPPLQDKWFFFWRRVGPFPLLVLVLAGQASPQFSIFRVTFPIIARLATMMFGIHIDQ